MPAGIDARLVLNPPPDANMRELCRGLMDVLWDMAMFTHLKKDAMCQFGLTKIFLRKQMIQSLDALRELKLQDMDKAAVLIQSVYRMYDCKRGFRAVQNGFARSQARAANFHPM